LRIVNAPTGTYIAYSTGIDQVAEDGTTGNSPYTQALAQAIVKPGVKLEDTFKEARRLVKAATDDKQTPWETTSITGDFYFVPEAAKPAATTESNPVAPPANPSAVAEAEAVPALAHAPAPAASEARRSWLGVQIQEVTDKIAAGLGLKETKGALVFGVTEKGPAAEAGILAGDVILEFDGQPVNAMLELPRMVADEPIGKEVQVKILRKGKEQTVTVKLARREAASAAADTSNPPADNNPAPAPIHGAPTPKSFHPPSTRAMQLGVFKQWTAFKSMEDERCFVGSNPAASPRT